MKNEIQIGANQSRIVSLDVIRGLAVLGILLMNIQSFSMPGQAYLNPMAFGDMQGLNRWVWIGSHILADQKFLSIFSMLFGASVLMIAQMAETKTGSSWKTHFSRNGWLLVIGLLHGSLFWYGDILAPYAVCSFVIYFFRKVSAWKLLVAGLLVFAISTVIHVVQGVAVLQLPPEVWAQMQNGWQPAERIVQHIISAYQGSFADQLSQRIGTLEMMYTELFPSFYAWRISGLMLIGMALFKSGFLQGEFDKCLYQKLLIYAGGTGLLLVIGGLFYNFNHDWALQYSMFFGAEFNYWGSLLMALAYISAIILWVKSGKGKRLAQRFGNVGRMALSGYLLQTFICTAIFYGFGLGLFGQVSRMGQLAIVLLVWAFVFVFANIWIRHFRFGPVEWLWRSLTKAQIQPLRK